MGGFSYYISMRFHSLSRCPYCQPLVLLSASAITTSVPAAGTTAITASSATHSSARIVILHPLLVFLIKIITQRGLDPLATGIIQLHHLRSPVILAGRLILPELTHFAHELLIDGGE